MSNHKLKSEQLGVNFGTAQHRLRKLVMFSLVRKLSLDRCHQCGEVIEAIEEFSLEHKEPWLHVSAELFWDIDNIAFSHLKCNSGAGTKVNRDKTHCVRGHKFTKLNTRYDARGYRVCKVCSPMQLRKHEDTNVNLVMVNRWAPPRRQSSFEHYGRFNRLGVRFLCPPPYSLEE